MLYDPSTQAQLRPWLIRTLEPICDADPLILADYVIALLNHDGPELELRKMFTKQLEEFLDQEASSFVETLFSALRSKAYIPYSTQSATAPAPSSQEINDNGIPIPLDALVTSPTSNQERGRKRPYDNRDTHTRESDPFSRPPPKGPRTHENSTPSRYSSSRIKSNIEDAWTRNGYRASQGTTNDVVKPDLHDDTTEGIPSQPRRTGFVNGSRGGSIYDRVGAQTFSPAQGVSSPKPICRDYHHKGYCARGALCNYSHGDDAMVPPNPLWPPPTAPNFNPLMGGMGFLPLMMPFGMPDPNLGFDDGAYDPNKSHMDMSGVNRLSHPLDTVSTMAVGSHNLHVDSDGIAEHNPQKLPLEILPQLDTSYQTNSGETFAHGKQAPSNVGWAPSTMGRAFLKDDKTLVIEKIPSEHLRLETINDWFKRFGTVTNVAIDSKGSKALLTFSTHEEASLAWKSEEAVFGNRFVKLYWHRPMEGQGSVGKRALQASASIVHTLTSRETQHLNATQSTEPKASAMPKSASVNGGTLSPEARAKAQALEKNIAEQKVLFSRLKTAQGEDRKQILSRIRVLSESMDESVPVQPNVTSVSKEGSNVVAHEANNGKPAKLEQLDKELDLQQAVQELTRRAQDPREDHDAIRLELAELIAKAAAEGIRVGDDLEQGPESSTSPQRIFSDSRHRHHAGRSRGRSRGYFRGPPIGRGAPRNLKLDNRPKALVVKGLPPGDNQLLDHVREWHQATGHAESLSIDDSGDVIVQFRTRVAAEQAFASSTLLKTQIKRVQVSWASHGSKPGGNLRSTLQPLSDISPMDASAQIEKEESGWGQGDDE